MNEVASVRLLMPLDMLCFCSSVIVVSIMNFTLKLAYQYRLTEKKRLITCIYCCLSIVLCGLPGPQERRKLQQDQFSVYIISKKKRLVYMHIVIYIVIIMVVFCGLPGPQGKDDCQENLDSAMDTIF